MKSIERRHFPALRLDEVLPLFDREEMSDDEMLALMLQEPRLVRRPIIRLRGRFLVGANLKAVEAALAE